MSQPQLRLHLDPRVHKVELLISRLLRIGVVSSLSVVIFGTIVSFVHHPDYSSSAGELTRLTANGAAFPHSLAAIVDGVRHFSGQSIVLVGLLLLIATPVMRVAISILTFLYQSDWIFVAITTTVLALLILSFVLGKAEA
jgi:uncharacterized membrane protein